MKGNFQFRVYMVDVDKDRAKALRLVLGKVIRGAGRKALNDMMRAAHNGERVLVYETNDEKDAKARAANIADGGCTTEVEDLREPEQPF
jgi:hypothetical protein